MSLKFHIEAIQARWQLGQGIKNPKLHDSRNYLETSELHLGNPDCFEPK
jgi:hypothetical protein